MPGHSVSGCVKLAWDSQLGISILPNHNSYFTILYSYGINRTPNSILQTQNQLQAFKRALLFPTFFLCSYFSLLFFLKMPYYPYFLVKNVWSDRKLYFFSSLRLLGVCKNQINLIWAAMMQNFIKYFFSSYNSFFGTLILVFPSHCNVVLLFSENFVCFLCLFLSLKTLRTSLLSLLFMIKIPTFFKILSPTLSLLFPWRALKSLQLHTLLFYYTLLQWNKSNIKLHTSTPSQLHTPAFPTRLRVHQPKILTRMFNSHRRLIRMRRLSDLAEQTCCCVGNAVPRLICHMRFNPCHAE